MRQLLITLFSVLISISASAKKVTRTIYLQGYQNERQVERRAYSLKGVYHADYRPSTRRLTVTYNDRIISFARIKTNMESYCHVRKGRATNRPVTVYHRDNNAKPHRGSDYHKTVRKSAPVKKPVVNKKVASPVKNKHNNNNSNHNSSWRK